MFSAVRGGEIVTGADGGLLELSGEWLDEQVVFLYEYISLREKH